ncbi:asparagine synthetase B family protein [Methylohalobius crimeensis]|uniref:asparagine synthetase B family protein n=1 Tax=Methylohalobius crimeensis TaxID=244365 RepID=UPI0003B7297D|nr:asparagine synthase-related protein [Methylohalobius crimeensis]
MYDIAGWFGSNSSKLSPVEVLNAMLGERPEHNIHQEFALASAQAGRTGSAGPISALITGHPRWQTSDLATKAARDGDASLLARLYEEKGLATLEQIGGSFALALYDREHGEGLLAIDRMGVAPLAYAQVPGGLLFADDLGTLRRHPTIDAESDPQALFAYLYFHMIPAPLSIYRDIHKLLPGQYLRCRDGKLESGFYWQPCFQNDSRAEPELALALRNALKRSVDLSLEHPATTGAFLSGGLDSSTVTGLFKELAPDSAEAFSIGFAAEGYDEMEYARASARHFGVPLHEYYVTPQDVVAAVPKIAAFYDEPFGNASAVPTYYCARLARDHGKTHLLAGDGGDELFAGNARYAKQALFAWYERLPHWLRNRMIEPFVALNPPFMGKVKSYVDQAKVPMPERMETYNFLHRTPLAEVFESEFLASVNSGWPLEHLQEIYRRPDATMLKCMLWLDWKITLADNDLRKVNRMCHLSGMDVNYPMLQDPLIRAAPRIPDRLLMRGFELRSFYRRTWQDFLPPETLNKRKHGFGLPFGVWLQSDSKLQELAYTSLEHRSLSGIIRKNYLHNLKQAHQSRHASYYGVIIWILMMWAQWFEHH